jgi:glycosyltransferase involved in cell wall biosynthesis
MTGKGYLLANDSKTTHAILSINYTGPSSIFRIGFSGTIGETPVLLPETRTMTASPLRITHFLPTVRLADGGVARTVLDWCKVFAERGHSVCLMCHDPADVPVEWMGDPSPGLPRGVVIPRENSGLLPLQKLKINPLERDVLAPTDILHLHAVWELENVRLAKTARQLNVPYLLSVHGMLDDWSMSQRSRKKRLYLALAGKRLLDQAATVHCTAEAELAQARKWFTNPNTAVLPCLVDMSQFEHLPGKETGLALIPEAMRNKPKVLFLSRLHEKKGVDVLIRAAAKLRDAGIDAVTLIAGVGEPACENQLKALVNELNLSDRVVFLGMVRGIEKVSLLQAVNLLALPTQQENFGLVLVEAMACGTPVITTQGTDIWQELQAAGAIITDRTPDAFAKQITQLLQNPQQRAKLGADARNWVMSSLAVQPLGDKYERLYQTLAVRPESPSPAGD